MADLPWPPDKKLPNDCSGVPTAAFAKLLDRYMDKSEEFDVTSWAKENGFFQTDINAVKRVATRITTLDKADKILTALGRNVSEELPIIALDSPGAAKRMAKEEFIMDFCDDPFAPDAFKPEQDVDFDKEWIETRAKELEREREAVLRSTAAASQKGTTVAYLFAEEDAG